jgi:hypothetical protein
MKTNIQKAAAAMGRKGGSAKTERKAAAAKANGAKGGRPAHEWLVIRDGRTPDKFAVWSKHKTEASAIKRCRELGRNGAEGHTLVINIADRAKYSV